jgi:transposase
LRRYRRYRIVGRTVEWLGNFRRLTVRYDRLLATYGGFCHLACSTRAQTGSETTFSKLLEVNVGKS